MVTALGGLRLADLAAAAAPQEQLSLMVLAWFEQHRAAAQGAICSLPGVGPQQLVSRQCCSPARKGLEAVRAFNQCQGGLRYAGLRMPEHG